MKKALLLLTVLLSASTLAQGIYPMEPSKGHYKQLSSLNSEPKLENRHLDEITYPLTEASSGTLIYTLVSPCYLTATQVETLKNSIQFPANSSEQTRAELEYLLEWQNNRTPEQVHRSKEILAPIGYWPHIAILKRHNQYAENLQNLFYIGRAAIGEDCKAENYPNTTKLLQGITRDMRIMEFTVKYHLLRARPYHLESKLNPLARISSPSFASGHTLWAYIHAFVWSELVPEKRKDFLALAYEVGESREIMGIHYPSDEEAARVLAHSMLKTMWNNPRFKKDYKAAQSEWKP